MQDKLVGYLLGALEIEEILFVEQALASDAEARHHLELLRLALAPLEPIRQEANVPEGLAQRTCLRIREVRAAPGA